MVKYGIVGAIALAVLVAATWDGKKKTNSEVAKTDVKTDADSAITGDVGAVKPPSPDAVKVAAPPPIVEAPKDAPRPADQPEEFLKYSVKKGDSFKSIAKGFLGDEKLADELLKANPRIIDARHLRPGITLIFPKSKLAGGGAVAAPVASPKSDDASQNASAGPPSGEGTAGSSLKAGMKKDDKPTEVPAGDKKYVVKAGDTLYGIAARELGKGSRWKEIMKLNNLDSEQVKKGQEIELPAK